MSNTEEQTGLVTTEITDAGVLQTELYSRIPFVVSAVQVTEDNMKIVASVCGGEILYSTKKTGEGENATSVKLPYIKVDVHHPLNERQTKAYAGDWILKSEAGYKVYTEKAFTRSFEKVTAEETPVEDTVEPVARKAFRHAGTGEFVTEAYAKENPDTTVSEAVYQNRKARQI